MIMMRTRMGIVAACMGLTVFLLLFFASCASPPDITGTWREVGKAAELEFTADGVFRAVDNQGMAVAGSYTLLPDATVRFVIDHDGAEREVIDLMIVVRGDELLLTSRDNHKVEVYQREK